MNNKKKGSGVKPYDYDYGNDFKVLSKGERREIMKTARNLLKQQQENESLLADTPVREKGSA